MSNEIQEYVERPEFGIERTTTRKTKKGVVTTTVTRGLLRTIVAGKADERSLAGVEYGLQLWERHQYGALIQDFLSVFPTLRDTAIAANEGAIAINPDAEQVRINGNYRKWDAYTLMGLACKATGADKGEKAKFVQIARAIGAAEAALRIRLHNEGLAKQLEQGLISQEEHDSNVVTPA